MKAAIITVGDEILIGQTTDTNSGWIAKKLTETGFEVEEIVSVRDKGKQIKAILDELFHKVEVILMTGGIGPTKDDITKKTLCEYFGTGLVFNEEVLSTINNVISSSFSLNELTRNQAYVPEDCTVIPNRVGTAPITWFEREEKILVSLPGVPYEMKYNMENEIIPRLKEQYKSEHYLNKVFLVCGYGESALSLHLSEFENELPHGFGLAYLPSPGLVKLRLYAKGEERKAGLEEEAEKLRRILGDALLTDKDVSLEKLLGERLFEKGLYLGTAESCTGGNISRLITTIPGSAGYFKGCVVSYSNEIKQKVLNVSEDSLEKYGAVSERVVREMVTGLTELLGVDCGIAVSGIAGPDGGSEEKPVGTTWIATMVNGNIKAQKYQFGKFRDANIMRASNSAMIQLLQMLDE